MFKFVDPLLNKFNYLISMQNFNLSLGLYLVQGDRAPFHVPRVVEVIQLLVY